MTVLWILGVILFALVLLSRLRLGVWVQGGGGDWQVQARVGPLRFQVYPPKAQREEKKPSGKSQKPPKEDSVKTKSSPKESSGTGEKKTAFPKVSAALLRSAYREVWPPLRRALSRLRRALRVDPLDVSVTIGAAGDPPEGAELYGLVQGAVWSGMPVLEQLLDIPDPHIHIGIDFDAPQPQLRLSAGVQVRLGALVAIALSVAVPVIRWYQNNLRREAPSAETSAAA